MTQLSNIKRLQGISTSNNPDLTSLYEECVAFCRNREPKPLLAAASTDSEGGTSPAQSNITSTSTSTTNAATTNPRATTQRLLRPLTLEEAVMIIMEFEENPTKQPKNTLPISIIRAMQAVLLQQSNSNKLEKALSNKSIQLSFEPASSQQQQQQQQQQQGHEKTPIERKKFLERMERLRLQNEASNYYKLTSNIDTNRNKSEDDITTKSMTYAASVGLNMIVAPISFGVFMYFFSGPILGFMVSEFKPKHPGAVDVRKVIIGVLSGVGMLFIEMMLFVIRTHEFEKGLKRKQHRQGRDKVKPFGDYTSQMEKTFTSDGTLAPTTAVANVVQLPPNKASKDTTKQKSN